MTTLAHTTRPRALTDNSTPSRIDEAAQTSSWYKGLTSGFSSANLLHHATDGCFVITHSRTPKTFVLCYRHGGVTYSEDIVDTVDGLQLGKIPRHFANLSDLVKLYSTLGPHSIDLKCVLKIRADASPTPPETRSSPTQSLSKSDGYVAPTVKMSTQRELRPRPPLLSSLVSRSSPTLLQAALPKKHEYAEVRRLPDEEQAIEGCGTVLGTQDPSHEYTELPMDNDSRRRMFSVLRGQDLLLVDPCIDQHARRAGWCAIGEAQARSLAKLNGKPVGSFVVRMSESNHYAALSMVVPISETHTAIYHTHIEKGEHGLHLAKSSEHFQTLSDLVYFYSLVNQPDLPVSLAPGNM